LLKGEKELHRRIASKCFNEAWKYLDMKKRTPKEDIEMLRLAHTSRFHWGLVGGARNFAIGDWQISRVYAALEQPALSLLFAQSSLKICEREKLSEFLPSALEGVARAYATARDRRTAQRYLARALKQLNSLNLASQEKKVYLAQIKDTQSLVGWPSSLR
jgi:hypothetical protein